MCFKIKSEDQFFQIGELNSSTTTQFDTVTGDKINTNTYWLDAREGAPTCDLPEIDIIGEKFYNQIYGSSIGCPTVSAKTKIFIMTTTFFYHLD